MNTMQAMLLKAPKQLLSLERVPKPVVKRQQVLLKVLTCGICRTDLHIFDNELQPPHLPLILGHQVVGIVEEVGNDVSKEWLGKRVGVPWLGSSCGSCSFCQSGEENLCDDPTFTGYTVNGGFAEYCVADSRFCFLIPKKYTDEEAAPLLCAGLIGYRAYKKADQGKKLGIYGFGVAAHLLIQLALHEGKEVYAFTRKGDLEKQKFALEMGACYASDFDRCPKVKLDSAIIFASDGETVPHALRAIRKGGIVVTAGIHMSDIPSFPYEYLWEARTLTSVANLSRLDGIEFFELAKKTHLKVLYTTYPLSLANEALLAQKKGKLKGAAVLKITD